MKVFLTNKNGGGKSGKTCHFITGYQKLANITTFLFPVKWDFQQQTILLKLYHNRVEIYSQVYSIPSLRFCSCCRDGHIDSDYEVDKVCLWLYYLFRSSLPLQCHLFFSCQWELNMVTYRWILPL